MKKKDSIKKVLKRLDEVGFEALKKELLEGNSNVSDSFQDMVHTIKEMQDEDTAIEEHVSSGKPVYTFTVKL